MTAHPATTMDPAQDPKRARRTMVLALAHLALALSILALFVIVRIHTG